MNDYKVKILHRKIVSNFQGDRYFSSGRLYKMEEIDTIFKVKTHAVHTLTLSLAVISRPTRGYKIETIKYPIWS